MPDINIIIVNWNACDDLRACLTSLYAPPKPAVTFTVHVVDNASTDPSVSMVTREFPAVHLLVNPSNLGFSRANNQAIAQTDSPYVLLLNSDATLHPGALDALVSFANAHPDAGIIGPRVLNPDGTLQFSCRRFPSLGAGFFRNTLLGRFFPRNKYAGDYLMTDADHTQSFPADWVSGCAMLLRRDLLDAIGLLDERFFMYCEDVDICLRAWAHGAKVLYCPSAVVTHAIGRSSDKNADRMIREFHHAWYLFDCKRHPHAGSLRRLLVWSGLTLRAWVRILNRRRTEARRRRLGLPPLAPDTIPSDRSTAAP